MATVTIHEAKTHLSRLVADAEAGKEVVIARGKVPAVKLVPVAAKPKRIPGRYAGQFTVPDSFFEPMGEAELALWYGDEKS